MATIRAGAMTDRTVALYHEGNALSRAGHLERAVEAYDKVVERSGHSEDRLQANVVAFALFNKGVALRGLGRAEDEIAAYDQLLTHVAGSTDPVRLHQALAYLTPLQFLQITQTPGGCHQGTEPVGHLARGHRSEVPFRRADEPGATAR